MLPVPRSWSTEEQIQQTDERTNDRSSSISADQRRSQSTSATLSELENEQLLAKQQRSIPEQSSEQLSDISSDHKSFVCKHDDERRSSVIEEIPEFRERVEYFRRMSKEESIEDTSAQSSNSSSQFTPNTAKRVAGKIVAEVQKRALEQVGGDEESSHHKMSKTTEQPPKDSQEEDGEFSF